MGSSEIAQLWIFVPIRMLILNASSGILQIACWMIHNRFLFVFRISLMSNFRCARWIQGSGVQPTHAGQIYSRRYLTPFLILWTNVWPSTPGAGSHQRTRSGMNSLLHATIASGSSGCRDQLVLMLHVHRLTRTQHLQQNNHRSSHRTYLYLHQ